PLQLRSGRLPRPDSLDEVAVDDGMAAALQATGGGGPLRVGASVRLTTQTGPDRFHVVGIGTEGSGAAGASFSRSAVYVTPREAANAFSLGLRTPLVALRAKAGLDAATLATGVERALGPAAIAVDPGRHGQAPLGDLRPLLALLVTLAILVGAGVGAGGVALSLEERRRDLGLLRVAGASRRQVRRLLLCEVGVIAAAGSGIGILLGMLVATLVDAHYLAAGLAGPPWYGGGRAVLLALTVGMGMAVIGSVPMVLRAAAMP